jgi:hypothetical protein
MELRPTHGISTLLAMVVLTRRTKVAMPLGWIWATCTIGNSLVMVSRALAEHQLSKVVIEGSQDSREMTENDLKVINEKVIAVLRIV